MTSERRTFARVQFGRGYTAKIMAIDGTWQRDCKIDDISDTGARLTVRGSLAGIDVQEFFLALTASGNAHRRCERIWLNGDEIGVRFLRSIPSRPRRRAWQQPARPLEASEGEPRG